jgi:hypothetical protein
MMNKRSIALCRQLLDNAVPQGRVAVGFAAPVEIPFYFRSYDTISSK